MNEMTKHDTKHLENAFTHKLYKLSRGGGAMPPHQFIKITRTKHSINITHGIL